MGLWGVLKSLIFGRSKDANASWRQVTFKVVLTDLVGDESKSAAQKLEATLNKIPQINAFTYEGDFAIPPIDTPQGERFEALRSKSREILAETESDLLIWGDEVAGTWRLGFIPGKEAELGHATFEISDLLILPQSDKMQALLESLFVGSTIAAVVPDHEDKFLAQRHLLAPYAREMKDFLTDQPEGLDQDDIAVDFLCLANIFRLLGNRTGKDGLFRRSIKLCQEALFRLEHTPTVCWSTAQLHLGDALLRVGAEELQAVTMDKDKKNKQRSDKPHAAPEKAEDSSKEEKTSQAEGEKQTNKIVYDENTDNSTFRKAAVSAFKEAMTVLTEADFPSEYARAQAKMGKALYGMVERGSLDDSDLDLLKEAANAFIEAEKVWTVESNPLRWADLQDCMGRVYYSWATRKSRLSLLEEAARRFRNALEVRKIESDPLFSAHCRNNLGACLMTLGTKKKSLQILQEARQCFVDAQDSFQEAGLVGVAHLAGRNVVRVDRALLPYNDEIEREAKAARLVAERAMEEELAAKMEEQMRRM